MGGILWYVYLISKEETEIQWKSTCLFPLPQKRALRTCWMLWCEIITQASNEAGLIISFLTLAIAGLCWCHFLSFSLLWLTLPALGSCLQAKMMLELKSWPSLANLTRCSKEIWTKMFSLLKKNIQTLIWNGSCPPHTVLLLTSQWWCVTQNTNTTVSPESPKL